MNKSQKDIPFVEFLEYCFKLLNFIVIWIIMLLGGTVVGKYWDWVGNDVGMAWEWDKN